MYVSKFIFLINIFKNLKKLANEIDIDFNELEHLDIKIILNAINNLEQDKLKKIILDNIRSNKRSFKFSRFVLTPDFVKDQNDFDFFHEIDTKENYITNKIIHGDLLFLRKKIDYRLLNNKIIIIENADPGFDFLFSHNIKGLITKYGGANSHMAIRCMELGLPAIIGLGTKKYLELINVKKIFIDCRNKNYSIIQ